MATYELELPTGKIIATECEKGSKIKITGHMGSTKVVTAKLNRAKGMKYFQYKGELWYPEQKPWKKVSE